MQRVARVHLAAPVARYPERRGPRLDNERGADRDHEPQSRARGPMGAGPDV